MDRARVRLTATYAVRPNLFVGIEANPMDNDFGLLANWRAMDETETRPALTFGTSSDRIGTTSGRAYFGMLSKDLTSLTGLPVAPYIGTAFGEFDDDFELIGGMNIRWADDWSSMHIWDGENLHHTVDHSFGNGWRAGLVVVEQDGEYYFGLSAGASLTGKSF